MTIQTGSVAYPDEVKRQQALSFSNITQLLFNAKYIGFNAAINGYAGSPNLARMKYSVVDSSGDFSTTLGSPAGCVNNYDAYYLSTGKLIYAGKTYDYMEGTTPDTTTKWADVGSTAGTMTQVDNQYVQLYKYYGSAQSETDIVLSSKGLDLKGTGAIGECILQTKLSSSVTTATEGGSTSVYLILRDESENEVTLFSDSDGATSYSGCTSGGTYTFRLIFTSGNCKVCDVSSTWTGSGSNVSTSSLSGSVWHLRFKSKGAVAGSGGATTLTMEVRAYPIVYVDGSSAMTSTTFETTTTTTPSNVGTGFLTFNDTTTNPLTAELSGNSGSNYTAITNNNFATVGTDGTGLKLRFTASGTPSELPKLYEYALWYGVWV